MIELIGAGNSSVLGFCAVTTSGFFTGLLSTIAFTGSGFSSRRGGVVSAAETAY